MEKRTRNIIIIFVCIVVVLFLAMSALSILISYNDMQEARNRAHCSNIRGMWQNGKYIK